MVPYERITAGKKLPEKGGEEMKGAILEKGETGYTYLKKLFLSIRHAQKDFNWLITDCQCCTQSEAFYQRIFQYDRYGWLSGEELTRMVETEDFQWIWAVLSGFPGRYCGCSQ